MPFTAGFLAKFYVLGAAADAGYYLAAVIAMVTAVVAAYLYLRIVIAMYFQGTDENGGGEAMAGPRVRVPAAAGLALTLAVAGVLFLGIVPVPSPGWPTTRWLSSSPSDAERPDPTRLSRAGRRSSELPVNEPDLTDH